MNNMFVTCSANCLSCGQIQHIYCSLLQNPYKALQHCPAPEFCTMGMLWPTHHCILCCRISIILYQHGLAESCPWDGPKVSAGSLQHASQEPIFAVKLDNSNISRWSALVSSSLVQLNACIEQDASFPTLRAKTYYSHCLVAPIPALL